jgi:hypothetical protein
MAGVPATALSYLALGDSYTIGEGVAQEGRWHACCARKASRWPIRASSPPPAGPPTS